MKPGTAKDSFLTPGEVDPRHFELLLEGTSIRAQPLIDALREHLVNGVKASEAWTKYGVNMSQFSRRLAVLRKESQRAAELSKFYP
ncbi:adhesion biosynthesis transcriptional regulator [Pseudomonas aeruginosa]|uniref:Major pilu subunit operon regulatory protein PapB n=2 Tax=Gammaproteobacteria TaxID=1236 RepID=A0A3T0VFT7_PSEAI|nr:MULTISPECIES: PapB/FocB family fimbrial expression transcriptional regulator [Pseudomonas]AZZ88886.1 Major pilu subunit operon regulatory protein PapB [Pseudomonas aeruginosa]EKU8569384.1 adhesion biosynthesis transcriptional regulator [Pseudomonas aeruginosa]EKX5463432.1 adhesion biosynthesis transcriptional regulator [Pseudomonas aeruginosa]MBF3300000.1 adhesion biosynthesis transcriptional regulator [Pseudomonas aeruginosa]MBJ7563160.1 adhesion biosynthesis transcriptional regulator [Pse